ncbi:MAG: hypothetical protein O2807_09720, partial [bacterium]|nr:hypothetical protein [bacterium]
MKTPVAAKKEHSDAPSFSPILDFCNSPLDRNNWKNACLFLLLQEKVFPFAVPENPEKAFEKYHYKGAGVTFGNITFVQLRLREILEDIASGEQFNSAHIELLNAALGEARGLRFRLDRILPEEESGASALSLNPQTFDLHILLHFIAARFLASVNPRRMRLCPDCEKIFLQKNSRRKKFCTDSCRFRYHNRVRVEN